MNTSEYRPLIDRDEVFLDTETTGLNPMVNEVVEFAAIKRNAQGQELDRLHLKIRAEYLESPPAWAEHLPGFVLEKWSANINKALEVNGCTRDELTSSDRMSPTSAAALIVAFIRNCTVIGQNVGFDMNFIEQMVLRAGVTQKDRNGNDVPARLPYHKIDTVTLAYEHLRPRGLNRLSLSSDGGICDFLDLPIEGAHTAMGDVIMTMRVYDSLTKETDND